METGMKLLNLVTLIILIVGGLNWGLVGLFNWDWFVALFGEGSMLARSVHILVGAAALWQLVPLFSAFESDPPHAFTGR
jgi:hypothetical protein